MANVDLISILESKLAATAGVADRLAYSIGRATSLNLAPLTLERLGNMTDSDMEVMDAYLFRYGCLVSNIQDSIFKSIGELELEPVSKMSNRDKSNLMERLGALPSAEAFSMLVLIRNKLMHEYPEEAQKHLDRINFITKESPELLDVFVSIIGYSNKFGISLPLEQCEHLLEFGAGICKTCKKIPCLCSVDFPPPARPEIE
jgi:hypothetical protein